MKDRQTQKEKSKINLKLWRMLQILYPRNLSITFLALRAWSSFITKYGHPAQPHLPHQQEPILFLPSGTGDAASRLEADNCPQRHFDSEWSSVLIWSIEDLKTTKQILTPSLRKLVAQPCILVRYLYRQAVFLKPFSRVVKRSTFWGPFHFYWFYEMLTLFPRNAISHQRKGRLPHPFKTSVLGAASQLVKY